MKNHLIIKKNNFIAKMVENLKEMLSVTLSAQIMILPVMLYHFNMLGIYFIFTNILVSCIIAPIMFLSIIFVIMSFINFEFSKYISIFLSLGMEELIQISNLSNLPFSKIYVITPSILFISIYYIFILIGNQIYIMYTSKNTSYTEKRIKNLIALAKYTIYQKKKKTVKIWNGIIQEKNVKLFVLKTYKYLLIILLVIIINCVNKQLEVHFIDVGQGDSCFIITPNHKTILIDGGGSTSNTFDVGEDTLIPYILDRGYKKIDYIFISHFDQDHSLGCAKIIENLTVSNLILNKQLEENDIYKHIVSIAKQKKVNLIYVKAGDVITLNGVKIKILHPQEKLIAENSINNNSIVFKLEYKSFSILFTGDIENIAEEVILSKNINLKADILKVAHHGSKTSSSQRFIEAVSPKIALIGVGKNNMFGHPNREVIERLQSYGTKIYRTDECGEISITVNNRGKIVGIKKCIK